MGRRRRACRAGADADRRAASKPVKDPNQRVPEETPPRLPGDDGVPVPIHDPPSKPVENPNQPVPEGEPGRDDGVPVPIHEQPTQPFPKGTPPEGVPAGDDGVPVPIHEQPTKPFPKGTPPEGVPAGDDAVPVPTHEQPTKRIQGSRTSSGRRGRRRMVCRCRSTSSRRGGLGRERRRMACRCRFTTADGPAGAGDRGVAGGRVPGRVGAGAGRAGVAGADPRDRDRARERIADLGARPDRGRADRTAPARRRRPRADPRRGAVRRRASPTPRQRCRRAKRRWTTPARMAAGRATTRRPASGADPTSTTRRPGSGADPTPRRPACGARARMTRRPPRPKYHDAPGRLDRLRLASAAVHARTGRRGLLEHGRGHAVPRGADPAQPRHGRARRPPGLTINVKADPGAARAYRRDRPLGGRWSTVGTTIRSAAAA